MLKNDYDYKWKLKKKRFYLRNKIKDKLLNTDYYLGRQISKIEYEIQKYLNDKEQLPFEISYEFEFKKYEWKVDLYSYNTNTEEYLDEFYNKHKTELLIKYPKSEIVGGDRYGKFWLDNNGKWILGGSNTDYRLYLDTIVVKNVISNNMINYKHYFFGIKNKKETDKILINEKYNW